MNRLSGPPLPPPPSRSSDPVIHAESGHLNGHKVPPALGVSDSHSDKHKPISPHKLMIGVPPASTPVSTQQPSSITASSHILTNGSSTPSVGIIPIQSEKDVHALQPDNPKRKQKERDHDIMSVPLAQLEQELPLEETDLVPLAALVERLANFGYESLQNLAETLPSLPSSSKRAKIFNTALDVRKQFIKLLVLSRWSADVKDLQKARNIIALLSEQQWQHEDVFAGLTDVRKILPNARMRNADLPTAIDALRTGTYRRLPASIKDMAVAQPEFSDKQALAIVSRLNNALRTRMLCHEIVPAPLSTFTVADGKVHLRVDGLFEAYLTASGDAASPAGPDGLPTSAEATGADLEDRWWLLDLKFDVAASGSCAVSTSQLFPKRPKKAYRERLRIWGDQELAPRSTADSGAAETANTQFMPIEDTDEKAVKDVRMQDIQQDADNPEDATQPSTIAAHSSTTRSSHQPDVPLVRLFAFLQERALHYQLDMLQHQAHELCRLNWGSNLQIETRESPRSLTLRYWVHAQSDLASSSAQDRARANSAGLAAGGSITIGIADLPNQKGASRIVAELMGGDDDMHASETSIRGDDGTDTTPWSRAEAMQVRRRGLTVSWDADRAIVNDADISDLRILPHQLDVEAVLTAVIRRHTTALLHRLQRQMLVGDHRVAKLLRPEDCTILVDPVLRHHDTFVGATEDIRIEYLRIDLQGEARRRLSKTGERFSGMPPLRLGVDTISGRLLLEAADSAASGAGTSASSSTDNASNLVTGFTASSLMARPALAPLADATERINGSLDVIFDVLQRLEIFARVEEWDRKASYVGLRTVRKLNFRVQELAKFGPSVSVNGPPLLFIPLGSHFAGYFLALQPSDLMGVNFALICVAQMVDAAGATSLTLQSIEWLDRSKITAATGDAAQTSPATNLQTLQLGKRKRQAPPAPLSSTTTEATTASEAPTELEKRGHLGEMSLEELIGVHSYSLALVSYFRVEQQLRMRGIPYIHVGSSTSRPAPPDGATAQALQGDIAKDSDAEETASAPGLHNRIDSLVPALCVRATDLLSLARSHLANANVAIRVSDWNDKERMSLHIVVKLRMKSRRFRALQSVLNNVAAASGQSMVTDARTWLEFDNHTATLKFWTKDLDNCIGLFQMQWERVSRMIELTREVLNFSRAWQARALRSGQKAKRPADAIELRRFTFQDVIFSYGRTVVQEESRSDRKVNAGGEQDQIQQRSLLVRVRWQDPKIEMPAFGGMPIAYNGGYVVEFGSIPAESAVSAGAFYPEVGNDKIEVQLLERFDPAAQWFVGQHVRGNPHNVMAFELRRTVNLAARTAMAAMAATLLGGRAMGVATAGSMPHQQERFVWRGFFQLLVHTLPLIREIEPLLQKSLSDADTPELEVKAATWFRLRFLDRYALDIRLASHSRLLICDASQPLFRSPVKGLTAFNMGHDNDVYRGSQLVEQGLGSPTPLLDKKKPSTYSSEWTREQSTHQFAAIPDFEELIRDVVDAVAANAGVGQVWDLRRALLVRLVSPSSSPLSTETLPSGGDKSSAEQQSVMHQLLSLLIDKVKAKISADGSHREAPISID
ncbi:MED14-domain-containing protein [Testicularia cyperi]|uniref:Mediator of RNA polymerase II transcription subunit 14 n=1 Tax=Testicularia cyperi TaxID=1882483 RepID=A0A317XNL6_9BASI|nr:MED14-domain-containing protein [Testicularia cyperi]